MDIKTLLKGSIDTADPVIQAGLALLYEGIQLRGMAGVQAAQQVILDLLEGKSPSLTGMNPRMVSDLVVCLQNAEALEKKAAEDFFKMLGDALAQVLATALTDLLA